MDLGAGGRGGPRDVRLVPDGDTPGSRTSTVDLLSTYPRPHPEDSLVKRRRGDECPYTLVVPIFTPDWNPPSEDGDLFHVPLGCLRVYREVGTDGGV